MDVTSTDNEIFDDLMENTEEIALDLADETDQEILHQINENAKVIALDLLPEKSRERYMLSYSKFMEWKKERKIEEQCFTEALMLVYFDSLKAKYKPSTIWVQYSMLKSVIQNNHNVTINYPRLNALLKKNSIGFQQKKSKVFRAEEIATFMSTAPDTVFLATKVIMIFGIYGATRGDELVKVEVQHVHAEGQIYLIKIPETKTNVIRSFTVDTNYAPYVRKYINLRPPNMPHSRFFINFQNGICTKQPIGRNKFHNIPKAIADFLNLEDAEKYTGHSFRRTSATLLADGGADLLTLKRHGGWKSSSVVEGYIEDSLSNKRKIGNVISEQIRKSIKPTVTSTMSSSTVTSDQLGSTATSSRMELCTQMATTTSVSRSVVLTESNNVEVAAVNTNTAITERFMDTVQLHNCSHITININSNK